MDESGNSGDLARTARDLSFGGQSIFALAAIGVADEEAFASCVDRWLIENHLQSTEIKAASVLKRPQALASLIAILDECAAPIIVEIMDKRFVVIANMTTALFLPPIPGLIGTPEDTLLRNAVAEFLHTELDITVLHAFLDACHNPDESAVRSCFDKAAADLAGAPAGSIAATALRALNDRREEFENDTASNSNAFRHYLPEPDAGKHGKPIWMLPSLSAFTNIYARINLYHDCDASAVRIVHDEQAHFDEIIETAKTQTEQLLTAESGVRFPHASFEFVRTAQLAFADSKALIGLQVADTVAGFAMRYFRDVVQQRKRPTSETAEAFGRLMCVNDRHTALGINFVVSGRDFQKAQSFYLTHY